MENIFKIYGAYNWNNSDDNKKNNDFILAINHLIKQVESRSAKNMPDNKFQIRYNRLRATAGSFLLDGIVERIKKSDALIFDITEFNPNVMFELGIAVESSRHLGGAKIFIICKGKDFKSANIPSDLAGYFVSIYEIKNNKPVFHDGNSLVMRLVSDIAEKFNKAYIEDEK
jgi:hypothetical protein